jgi:hypothetical protein
MTKHTTTPKKTTAKKTPPSAEAEQRAETDRQGAESEARHDGEIAKRCEIAKQIAALIAAFDAVGHNDPVAGLGEFFEETTTNLLRAMGLLAHHLADDDGDNEAVEEANLALSRVLSSLRWCVRRPLEEAGVIPAAQVTQ